MRQPAIRQFVPRGVIHRVIRKRPRVIDPLKLVVGVFKLLDLFTVHNASDATGLGRIPDGLTGATGFMEPDEAAAWLGLSDVAKPSQGRVPADLTLASAFSFCSQ